MTSASFTGTAFPICCCWEIVLPLKIKLSDFIDKSEGDKTDSKIIKKNFKKQVIPFIVLMKSWLKGKIRWN